MTYLAHHRRWLAPLAVVMGLSRAVLSPTLVVVDGISGKTRSLVDLRDTTHLFDQSDTSKQVALPATHADYSSLCWSFSGAEYYTSTRTGAQWAYMHDGSGGGAWGVSTQTDVSASRRILGTRSSAGNLGFSATFNTTPALNCAVLTSAGTIVNVAQNIAANTPVSWGFQYLEGGALPQEYAFRVTGVAETTGNSTSAPEATAAVPMVLGARATLNDLRIVGRVAVIAFTGGITAAQRAALRASLQQITGVAA